MTVELDEEATAALCDRITAAFADGHPFEAARSVAPALGGRWHGDHATVAVWTPGLSALPESAVELELFRPRADVDPGETRRRDVRFERVRLPTRRAESFTVAAVTGVRPGTRDRLGVCYRLRVRGDAPARAGETVTDPLAVSTPFGAFAPAELYDTDRLHADRADADYFARLGEPGVAPAADETDQTPVRGAEGTRWHDGPDREPATEPDDVPRFAPATNVLEVHPGTATASGTLAGLTRTYEEIGRRQTAGEPLTPAQRAFAGYDAVQLMPIEPVTEDPEAPAHWEVADDDATDDTAGDGAVTVTVGRPDQINWGYDVVVSGFGAPNPAVLESGRPDELVDLIETLHTLPEPKTVVFDVALGHAETRATELLPEPFLAGPGMYGQELDYTQPVVRATLLELLRRKLSFGADGVRVDGAQDFTNHDDERGEWHDDDFLAAINDMTLTVAGTEYRPWLIYEDGRPWPRQDWELASTYRTLIEQHPHSFQWGPLTFAHNTPALLTFWASKWWRIRELADRGEQWISGVANHDTLRRGSQLPVPDGWEGDPIDPYLGDDPVESYREAYDGPAVRLFTHAFLPGVPMDFLHANRRAPWAFVRTTDPDWRVKVAAEEHEFLRWHVRPETFGEPWAFPRLSEWFDDLAGLRSFADTLAAVVEATDDGSPDWTTTAAAVSAADTPLGEVTAAELDEFARAWMRDVHDYCRLSHWDDPDPARMRAAQAAREFRRARPWLRRNLADADDLSYRHPTEGTVLAHGVRHEAAVTETAATDGETVLFVANLEGEPVTVTPGEIAETEADPESFRVALAPPRLRASGDGGGDAGAAGAPDEPTDTTDATAEYAVAGVDGPATTAAVEIELSDGDAVVYVRE